MNRLHNIILWLGTCLICSTAMGQPSGDWFNYEIEALDCYRLSPSEDCDEQVHIVAGDTIELAKVSSTTKFFHLTKNGEVLKFEVPDTTPQGTPTHPAIRAKFIDTQSRPPTDKILELTAIRLSGEPNEAVCERWLENRFGNRMKTEVRESRCMRDNLFYWKVSPEISTEDPPGDGEGTGSGSGN